MSVLVREEKRMSAKQRSIRAVAMLEPLGDYGIGGYAYELAEGLAANGVRVDVYTERGYPLARLPLPRRHRLLPVLGGFAFRQRDLFRLDTPRLVEADAAPAAAAAPPPATSPPRWRSKVPFYSNLRHALLPLELAAHMKRLKYDLVWTQFPLPRPYWRRFRGHCRRLGIKVVHTVHDVLPHEPRPEHVQEFGAIYHNSDFLIVHSQAAKTLLHERFPKISARVIVAPHGLYTMFPRIPDARSRVRRRLGIRDDQAALLFFGCVRPYKNIDSVLRAMTSPALQQAVLIVAGREIGYPDLVPGDALGRTRRIAEELKITSQLRLCAGLLDIEGTAEIFEAADIALFPYTETYGSGSLLLAMTFGKFVVSSRSGGLDEHLANYPRHVLLDQTGPVPLTEAVVYAMHRVAKNRTDSESPRVPELDWTSIARHVLQQLAE